MVIAANARLSAPALRHLARHASIGRGWGDSLCGNSSGDPFLAFSITDFGPVPQHAPAPLTRAELNMKPSTRCIWRRSGRSRNR